MKNCRMTFSRSRKKPFHCVKHLYVYINDFMIEITNIVQVFKIIELNFKHFSEDELGKYYNKKYKKGSVIT